MLGEGHDGPSAAAWVARPPSLGVTPSRFRRATEANEWRDAAARRRRELEVAQERYRREEDQRRVAQALAESNKQLADIMERWAAATAVKRFFLEAESRIGDVEGERCTHLKERLALARSMVGPLDPLAFLAEWLAPEERYKSKYGKAE
jgi:hypothetical protein